MVLYNTVYRKVKIKRGETRLEHYPEESMTGLALFQDAFHPHDKHAYEGFHNAALSVSPVEVGSLGPTSRSVRWGKTSRPINLEGPPPGRSRFKKFRVGGEEEVERARGLNPD